MCISSSPSEHRAKAVIGCGVATPSGGYADSSAAGKSADRGGDNRALDLPHDRGLPTWRFQPIAVRADPSGGAFLQAMRGLTYPLIDDRLERRCAGWVRRPTLGDCRQPSQLKTPSVPPFVLPHQLANCSFRLAFQAQVAQRQIDGVQTGRSSRSCAGHRPIAGSCRTTFWATCHVCRQPDNQHPARHHQCGRVTPNPSYLLVDRARLGRPRRSPPHDPPEASLPEHHSRDAMNAVRPSRSRLAQRRVATIQSGAMPADVAVEQRDPCCIRDERDAPFVAQARSAATAAEMKRAPTASLRAGCRHWGRKGSSRMGPGTRPRSLGGEPSRFEGGSE